jgi:hypothetical protein
LLLFLRSTKAGYVPIVPTERPIQTFPDIATPLVGVSKTRIVAHELEQVVLRADPGSDVDLIVQTTAARTGLNADVNLAFLGTPELQDPVRRTAWITIALAEGKTEVLDEVQRLFVRPASSSLESLRSLVVQNVTGIRSPTAWPQLAALLRSARGELALAAAVALRQLRHPATLPDLILALDHSDQEIRYQAIMGLAELEPGVEAGPSFDLYREDESRHIQRWKQWWGRQG